MIRPYKVKRLLTNLCNTIAWTVAQRWTFVFFFAYTLPCIYHDKSVIDTSKFWANWLILNIALIFKTRAPHSTFQKIIPKICTHRKMFTMQALLNFLFFHPLFRRFYCYAPSFLSKLVAKRDLWNSDERTSGRVVVVKRYELKNRRTISQKGAWPMILKVSRSTEKLPFSSMCVPVEW